MSSISVKLYKNSDDASLNDIDKFFLRFISDTSFGESLASFNEIYPGVVPGCCEISILDIKNIFRGLEVSQEKLDSVKIFLNFALKKLSLSVEVIRRIEEIQGIDSSQISQESMLKIREIVSKELGIHIEDLQIRGKGKQAEIEKDTIDVGELSRLIQIENASHCLQRSVKGLIYRIFTKLSLKNSEGEIKKEEKKEDRGEAVKWESREEQEKSQIIIPNDIDTAKNPGGKFYKLLQANPGTVLSFNDIMEITGLEDDKKIRKAYANLNQKKFTKDTRVFGLGKMFGFCVYCQESKFDEIKRKFLGGGNIESFQEGAKGKIPLQIDSDIVDKSSAMKKLDNQEKIQSCAIYFKEGSKTRQWYQYFYNNGDFKELKIKKVPFSRESANTFIRGVNNKLEKQGSSQRIEVVSRGVYKMTLIDEEDNSDAKSSKSDSVVAGEGKNDSVDTISYIQGELFTAPENVIKNICDKNKKWFNFEKQTVKEKQLDTDQFIFCVLASREEGFEAKDFLSTEKEENGNMNTLLCKAQILNTFNHSTIDIIEQGGIYFLRKKTVNTEKKSIKLLSYLQENSGRIIPKAELLRYLGVPTDLSLIATRNQIKGEKSERIIQVGSIKELEGFFYGTLEEFETLKQQREKISKGRVHNSVTTAKLMISETQGVHNKTNTNSSEKNTKKSDQLLISQEKLDTILKRYSHINFEFHVKNVQIGNYFFEYKEMNIIFLFLEKMGHLVSLRSLESNSIFSGINIPGFISEWNTTVVKQISKELEIEIDNEDPNNAWYAIPLEKHRSTGVVRAIKAVHKNFNTNVRDIARVAFDLQEYCEKTLAFLKDTDSAIITNYAVILYNLSQFDVNNLKDKSVLTELLERSLSGLIYSTDEMNRQEIGNALYGLQNLDSSVITRDFMDALGDKIRASSAEMDGQGIGTALYGLQNLDSSVITRDFMDALGDKIRASSAEMDGQGIGNALYGLYYLNIPQEWKDELQQYMIHKMEMFLEKGGRISQEDENYFVHITALYNIPCDFKYSQAHKKTSQSEVRFQKLLDQNAINGYETGVEKGGVEMDIYFPELELNIEIDGKSHVGNKIYRDGKRDAFLMDTYGISTVRVGPFGTNIDRGSKEALDTIQKIFLQKSI